MSRIAAPRGTPLASLLLVVVFVAFGLWIDGRSASYTETELWNVEDLLLSVRAWTPGP